MRIGTYIYLKHRQLPAESNRLDLTEVIILSPAKILYIILHFITSSLFRMKRKNYLYITEFFARTLSNINIIMYIMYIYSYITFLTKTMQHTLAFSYKLRLFCHLLFNV